MHGHKSVITPRHIHLWDGFDCAGITASEQTRCIREPLMCRAAGGAIRIHEGLGLAIDQCSGALSITDIQLLQWTSA